MRDGKHFELVAAVYGAARPAYPGVLYETLEQQGVIGHGRQVLEIGAGSGEATGELVRRGSTVVAVEPGYELAALLQRACPEVSVAAARIEEVDLPEGQFDSVVAATAMHWVDLPTMLPELAKALRPGGFLAVWRTVYGDPRVETPFRRAIDQIVSARGGAPQVRDLLNPRPTVRELEAEDAFRLVRTWQWSWQIDLTAEQLRSLFATFSDWTNAGELDQVHAAAQAQPGPVTEHYVTILHLLQSATEVQ